MSSSVYFGLVVNQNTMAVGACEGRAFSLQIGTRERIEYRKEPGQDTDSNDISQ
jgi:hypothetical protein